MIFDKTNYTQMGRPRAGDKVLNNKGKVLSTVLRVRHNGAIVARSEHLFGMELELCRGMHWEAWFENGGRMRRP